MEQSCAYPVPDRFTFDFRIQKAVEVKISRVAEKDCRVRRYEGLRQ